MTQLTETQVAEKVCEVVARLAPSKNAVTTLDARLVEDFGYHSLALLELAVELEELFNLPPMDEESAQGIDRVADVVRLVSDLISKRAEG
jgi:acyl carrier protein